MKVSIRIIFLRPAILFCQQSFRNNKANYDDIKKRMNIAVESGIISEEDANKRLEAYLDNINREDKSNNIEIRFKRLGFNNIQEIKSKLKANKLTDDQLELILPAMLRLIHVLKNQGKDSPTYQRITQHLENKVGLTDIQIKHVIKYSNRLVRSLE